MSEQPEVNRGAAEDASGSPLTETEIEASRRPPSQPGGDGDGDGGGGSAADPLAGTGGDGSFEALEERPEVVSAIEDDTTVPGLGGDESGQRF